MSNQYCSIDEAFADPLVNRRKKNSNNSMVEGFECLSGKNQLNISDEYSQKGDLSRSRPQETIVNSQLNSQTNQASQRPDEKHFYPDMSLENEYALITDVHHKETNGYRPPNPFTHQSTLPKFMRSPDFPNNNTLLNNNNTLTNDGMYESFDKDNVMFLEDEPPKQHVEPNPQPEDPYQILFRQYQQLEDKLNQILEAVQQQKHQQSNDKENVYDIILFAIFGLFFIYILDSVYRVGRKK